MQQNQLTPAQQVLSVLKSSQGFDAFVKLFELSGNEPEIAAALAEKEAYHLSVLISDNPDLKAIPPAALVMEMRKIPLQGVTLDPSLKLANLYITDKANGKVTLEVTGRGKAVQAIAQNILLADAVKLSKAKIRAIVFDKCGGKCAYCGVDLVKSWNVDHVKPQIFGGTNDLDNLNPSCKDCNNYKCHTDLEGYRKQLHKMLNEKLEYLFKSKTKMQVAMNMGSIKHIFWDGKFHFERIGSSCR